MRWVHRRDTRLTKEYNRKQKSKRENVKERYRKRGGAKEGKEVRE